MKDTEVMLIIAAGIIFYLGVDRIVKAVEGLVQPKKKEENLTGETD